MARFKSNTRSDADCFCFFFVRGDTVSRVPLRETLSPSAGPSVGDADALDALYYRGGCDRSANRARLEGGQGLVARGHGEVDVAVAERGVRVVPSATTGSPGSSIAGRARGRRRGERVAAPRLDRANLVVVVRGDRRGSGGRPRRARAPSRARFAPPRAASTVARVRARGGGRARVLRPREGTRGASTPPGARAQPPRASAPPRSRAPPVPRPALRRRSIEEGIGEGPRGGGGARARL